MKPAALGRKTFLYNGRRGHYDYLTLRRNYSCRRGVNADKNKITLWVTNLQKRTTRYPRRNNPRLAAPSRRKSRPRPTSSLQTKKSNLNPACLFRGKIRGRQNFHRTSRARRLDISRRTRRGRSARECRTSDDALCEVALAEAGHRTKRRPGRPALRIRGSIVIGWWRFCRDSRPGFGSFSVFDGRKQNKLIRIRFDQLWGLDRLRSKQPHCSQIQIRQCAQ